MSRGIHSVPFLEGSEANGDPRLVRREAGFGRSVRVGSVFANLGKYRLDDVAVRFSRLQNPPSRELSYLIRGGDVASEGKLDECIDVQRVGGGEEFHLRWLDGRQDDGQNEEGEGAEEMDFP